MNLQKLFEAQRVLDEHILNEHPVQENENRLEKKILALQVELGECANEWRGFKFWSTDQEPRTRKYLTDYTEQDSHLGVGAVWVNPLLEEYVDCLHFILSIGLEIDAEEDLDWDAFYSNETDVTKQFQLVFTTISEFSKSHFVAHWRELFEEFYWLGDLLGFNWKQICEAYLEKNNINHQRQEAGY
ncbi:dUTP diphosphatase [Lysinibacillus halotolerans]|uniref:dUTPase n=1 Tax=Lysinibacillus halotolerans TaxID=1368476 RepID=A0A3M8HD60_9BACI|nr:dUTP diphosphatase [Lysinibacillus halotolerans]RND00250.1 hypothetical protein EC501_05610 [Lysinibacillus halotolerans]